MNARVPRVLTIAGVDSGGAAGVAADLKAFARCGAHGLAAIVALTAQNTVEVRGIHEVPPDFVRAQIDAVLDDIGADAAKTGMLFSAELIEAVAETLAPRGLPLVVDPVMLASSGSRLLLPDAVGTLVGRLFPLATVVTPNLPEAQALTAMMTEDRAALAERLVAMGARAALVTGGHGAEPVDHLFDGSRHMAIPVARHGVAATHGAGCTHSAALAAGLGAGLPLAEAARQAAVIAGQAVEHGLPWLGAGEGPVHVLHEYRAMTAPATERDRAMSDSFSAELWQGVAGVYDAILAHPFLTGLTDGSLPHDAFAFYVVQDAIYLHGYAQALAAVASRAPTPSQTEMFARHAADAIAVEKTLHGSLLTDLGIDPVAAEQAEPAPTNLAYTSYLLAAVRQRVLRGGGRRGPAVLLDLLGGRQGTAAPRLARPPLPAVDRHLRERGVRRRGAGRDRRDRRDGTRSRSGRTRPGSPPLPYHEPLRVDVLGHGLPQRSLARLIC